MTGYDVHDFLSYEPFGIDGGASPWSPTPRRRRRNR
jgi:hypothetical protein